MTLIVVPKTMRKSLDGIDQLIDPSILRSKFTGKKLAFFIILIDSLYLQESVVPKEKFEKNVYPKKGQKP